MNLMLTQSFKDHIYFIGLTPWFDNAITTKANIVKAFKDGNKRIDGICILASFDFSHFTSQQQVKSFMFKVKQEATIHVATLNWLHCYGFWLLSEICVIFVLFILFDDINEVFGKIIITCNQATTLK